MVVIALAVSSCSYTQEEKLCDAQADDELSLQLVGQGRDLSGWWVEVDHGKPNLARWALFVDPQQKPRWVGDLERRPTHRGGFTVHWPGATLRFGCAGAKDKPLIVGAQNVTGGRRPLIHTGLVPVPTPLAVHTVLVESEIRNEKLYLKYAIGDELFAEDPPKVTETIVFGYVPDSDEIRFKVGTLDELGLERERPPQQ